MNGPPAKSHDAKIGRTAPWIETAEYGRDPYGYPLAPHEPAHVDWHPVAKRWYESLERSGQAHFYTAGDWATAYFVAEAMSRDLKPQAVGTDSEDTPIIKTVPVKSASLSAYMRAMNELLVTASSRRSLGIELQTGEQQEPVDDTDDVLDAIRGTS